MLISKPSAYASNHNSKDTISSMSRRYQQHNAAPHPPGYGQASNASKYTSSHHHNDSKFGLASTVGNHSTLGNNDTALNYYPHLLQPTRMSEAIGIGGGAGSSNSGSNRSPSTRMSLKNAAAQSTAKTVAFYRSGDVHMQEFKVAITRRHFRTFDSLLEALSDRIPLPFGVRTVSTPNGTHGISRLEEFEDGKAYVCSDKKTVKPLNISAAKNHRPPWFISKPRTRNRAVAQLVRRNDSETLKIPLRLTQVKTPKKIVVVRNGDPTFRHSILLSRRTPQSFESIMEDIGEIFRMRVHRLYSADGRKVESLQALFLGPNVYVAGGREAFQPMEYKTKRVAILDDKKDPSSHDPNADLSKERTPKELKKTKGKWRVKVLTSELPAAGTDSRVMITVYGTKGNSGPILLSDGNKTTFMSGNEDEFVINVGAIGEIRKIRIAHDNSGTSPGWLCESITLSDVTTGDTLDFHCNKWLSRDEDDGEIMRELPAQIPGKSPLPEITYVVSITTGNLWNGGTEAEIMLTLYGDLGDSGPRLLQRGGRPQPQVKGTTDVFRMNAISLGTLYRVVIGHDNSEPGSGWFLEKITVKEDRVGAEEWVFECQRWLDAGEEDRKTVRELYAEQEPKMFAQSRSRSQSDKHKDDLWWDLEKWKFQRGNHVILLNHATMKAVRVRADAGIDGLGDPSHPHCVFEVLRRRGNIRAFSNVSQPSFHMALDQNRMLGQGKGGTFCEFQVKVTGDRSVTFESCKYPGQHATFDPSGKPSDTRGNPGAPGKLFTVYVKGCFRHDSVILLNTSPTQSLALTSNGDVIGTGRRNDVEETAGAKGVKQYSRLRVVKVAEGVRMFQCDKDPRRFLRIKDGQCDALGSGGAYCHFKVQKYKIGGYVTLQSMKNRGVFIGLNTNGRARPTVDTGDANTQFYPEVLKFGEMRSGKAELYLTPEPSFLVSAREPLNPPSPQKRESPEKPKTASSQVTLQGRENSDSGPKDGDFRIYVTTGNAGTSESVALVVYGTKGTSKPIILGKGTEGGVFQCGQTDEFQANLVNVGEVRKIRIGMEECSSDCDWRLKQVKMKDMTSNEVLRFKFNRWLSRSRDDGSTLRELPVTTQGSSPTLPVLRYVILVRTSKQPVTSTASSRRSKSGANQSQPVREPEVYLSLHGDEFDTGRRLLMKKPPQTPESPSRSNAGRPLFRPGQLDKFEIEAVSVGELTKCVISCPKTSLSSASQPAWLCEEIVIREADGASNEYVFPCKKWLGSGKPGAKNQLTLELGQKREVKRKQSDATEYSDGDWKISLTTGTQEGAGTTANVMFVACGNDRSTSGPVLLGNGSQGLFEVGTTERFKVNLAKVNDLQKIRISHDSTGSDPSWYVDKVKLKDANSDVTHTLDVKKWLSLTTEPYQMALEIPIPKPGQELMPVLMYKVLVYTGSILGSDTEANVYISIYGEKGDTGRRPLHRSLNNTVKFQESQIDIFEVEAVQLGDLTKIEIGHDGVGPGSGWFLHKVLIKETEISPRDYIFFCNRWLDDGQDDGKIERVINVEPPDESDSQDLSTEGEYKVYLTTSADSSEEPCPSDANISMVVYGEDGKTGQILLQPVPSREGERVDTPKHAALFKPGHTDEFKIDVPEIGPIYKMRLSLNEECAWQGIYLEKIVLEKVSNKNQLVFMCNRWLSSVEDDQETIREFPISKDDEPSLPVHTYFISATTGDRPGAATDANIYVTIRGERGDTGLRRLDHNRIDAWPFQRGKTSSFSLDAVDLGRLQEIVVSHDGRGYGSGWFLDKVTVREHEFGSHEWVFPCRMWLDDHVGDLKTVRRLAVLGTCDVTTGEDELQKLKAPPSRETSEEEEEDHADQYDVTVAVGEVMTQGNGTVALLGYVEGEGGEHGPIPLGDWTPGDKKEFKSRVEFGEVGEIFKLRVEMQDSEKDFNLLLHDVTLQNVRTEEQLSFAFHRRFRTSNGSTAKELPALRCAKPYKSLITYILEVNMSPSNPNVGSEGRLCVRLQGSGGSSGFRTLFNRTNGFKATQRDVGYTFQLEAVDLGELNKATIAYYSDEHAQEDAGGWKVDELTIRVPELPNSYAGEIKLDPTYSTKIDHTFKPIKSVSRVEKEFDLEAHVTKKPPLNRTFRKSSSIRRPTNVKTPENASTGYWTLALVTSAYDEGSIFNRISARVFGTRDTSDEFDVSYDVTEGAEGGESGRSEAPDDFQTRTALVRIEEDLGQIYMLRISLNKESAIRVYKVKLKDSTNGQEFLCHVTANDRLYAVSDDLGMLHFDLALSRPDEQPLKHHKYDVCVKTGEHPASATDAEIRFNLVGILGDTGFRKVARMADSPSNLFAVGKVDRFSLETVDVGEPRKVVIGHAGKGRGAGWFLDDVTISESRDEKEGNYKFFLRKWLDDSVDDKVTEREMQIVASHTTQPQVDPRSSKGPWNCRIVSKSDLVKEKSYDIRITFCFVGGRTRDVVRQVTSPVEEFEVLLEQREQESGEEEEEENEEDEEKEQLVKIRTEVESSNVAMKRNWPVEEILMNNRASGEELRFIYDDLPAWEGSLRGHVRELPVWRPNLEPRPVVEYYVVFNTSGDSQPTFNPSLVTVQLKGCGNQTSGWRKIVTQENSEDKFKPGRIDVFTIEAVDLGDVIDCVSINVGGPVKHAWALERVKVRRGYHADEEQVFQCTREIKEDEVVDLTDPTTVACIAPSTGNKAQKAPASSTFTAQLFWTGLDAVRKSSANDKLDTSKSDVHLQLFGSRGSSDLVTVDPLKSKTSPYGRRLNTVKVQVNTAEFGDIRKLGFGLLSLSTKLPEELTLAKLKLTNQELDHHYSFRPDHQLLARGFPGPEDRHLTGLNWIELVPVLPRQDPQTISKVVDYDLTIRTAEGPNAGLDANVYVTMKGASGESGKRWLLATSSGKDAKFDAGSENIFTLSCATLGELKQITIGHDGRDITSGWHLDNVAVTSSAEPSKKILFPCQKWLTNLEEGTFIERTLNPYHGEPNEDANPTQASATENGQTPAVATPPTQTD